jgi:hypothetical protein
VSDTGGPAPDPKSSETDPPAADGPVGDSPGDPEPPDDETQDPTGRRANDPSLTEGNVVPEVMQAPPGKPDGEVDTAFRRQDPPVKRNL